MVEVSSRQRYAYDSCARGADRRGRERIGYPPRRSPDLGISQDLELQLPYRGIGAVRIYGKRLEESREIPEPPPSFSEIPRAVERDTVNASASLHDSMLQRRPLTPLSQVEPQALRAPCCCPKSAPTARCVRTPVRDFI